MKALRVITPNSEREIDVHPERTFTTSFLKKHVMDIKTPFEFRESFKAELKRRRVKMNHTI